MTSIRSLKLLTTRSLETFGVAAKAAQPEKSTCAPSMRSVRLILALRNGSFFIAGPPWIDPSFKTVTPRPRDVLVQCTQKPNCEASRDIVPCLISAPNLCGFLGGKDNRTILGLSVSFRFTRLEGTLM